MIRLITILVIVKLFKCTAEVDTVVTSYIYGIYIYIYIFRCVRIRFTAKGTKQRITVHDNFKTEEQMKIRKFVFINESNQTKLE